VPCSGGDPQVGVLLEPGVATGKEMLAALERVEARLLRVPVGRRPLRLIVIDSIANVFRSVSCRLSRSACSSTRLVLGRN
jgi:hypothetical protein